MASLVMENESRRVKIAVACSLLIIIVSAYLGVRHYPLSVPTNPSPSERLVFALRHLALSMIPLMVGISRVASFRGNDMTNLGFDPTKEKTNRPFEVARRFLQNTLEQTVLHVVIQLALSTMLPADWLGLTPTLVCIFLIGRAVFLIGYMDDKRPTNRALGFALTYIGNVVSFVLLIVFLIWNGPNFQLGMP